MKLIDQFRRQPAFISFGRSSAESGFVNVELGAVRNANSVTITAADGSVAPIAAADASNAGVLASTDKIKLDSLTVGGGQTPPTDFSHRGVVTAANIDVGVSHLRTAGYSAIGDGGAALYRRVTAQPTHALKIQSLDGAWWELVPEFGRINVLQAGAVGDNITDDSQAFLDCLKFAKLNAIGTFYASTFGVDVPPGTYYLGSTTLEIKARVHLRGQSSGQPSGRACQLRWAANTTGIIVHRFNTLGAATEVTPSTAGDGSIIEGLDLISDGGTIAAVTDDTKGHAIWLRARASLIGLTIDGFAGNGIHIRATAGAGGAVEGNANNWLIERARITKCHKSGIYVDGADVNAGVATMLDASSNGRWGIWDSSFLGNTWVACHSAGNGLASTGENGTGQSSFVHYNGPENGNTNLRYAANAAATEAALASTVPGTNKAVWIEIAAGASHPNIPTWIAAQPAGTYFHGGAYHTDGAVSHNVIIGCYEESGQAASQLAVPTLVLGGLTGLSFVGNAPGLSASSIGGVLHGAIDVNNHDIYAPARNLTLRLNASVNHLLKLTAGGDHVAGVNLVAWDETTGQWIIGEHANLGARRPIRVTTDLNTRSYGRASTADVGSGQVAFERGFWLGNGSSARYQSNGTAAPATGTYARGDIVWNSSPAAGGTVGWICVTAGSPGTWKTFGTIQP